MIPGRMCGVAGIIMKNGGTPERPALEAMRDALVHRGPDGTVIHIDGAVGLVHTRLSIIDVEGGGQPLRSSAGSALIGNGEIYNDIELRAVEAGRVRYRSGSDFESALTVFDRDGARAVDQLRGMYGIAVWRAADGTVVLARDPFGIKPLYTLDCDEFLAFASEPRAFFAAGLATARQEPGAPIELLQRGYLTGARTPYRGILRVAPGTAITLKNGTERERYTVPPTPPPNMAPPHDLVEAVASFDRVFEDSVYAHQRSDVPYGMFLSGGIDSCALLAMMARLNDRPVSTFTCGFSGADVHDERVAARRVAEACGAEHTEIEFSEDDFWAMLPAIADALDDPTMDYAVLPTFKLAAAASERIKVVLTGEGGDEIFAGYGRYRYLMKPWWRGGKRPGIKGLFEGTAVLRDRDRSWAERPAAVQEASRRAAEGKLQAAQMNDIRGWLPADLLLKLDRCLMAHGVEGRTPFLDPIVAAYGFHLPDSFKIARDRGKWVVRHWLARHCPAAEAFGKKKGFTVPVGGWIARRGDTLGALVAAQPAIDEIAHPRAVVDLFRDATGKRGRAAWSLLFYAVWHKRHIEGAALAGDLADFLRR